MFKLTIKPIHIITVFIVVMIGGIVVLRALTPAQQAANPSPSPMFPSGIPNPNSSIDYNLQIPGSSDKKTLPAISADFRSSDQSVPLLEESFGLGKARELVAGDFRKYYWTENREELSYYPASNTLAYLNQNILHPSTPLTDGLNDRAASYIRSKLSTPPEIELAPLKTLYLKSNGSVSKEVGTASGADLIEIEYRFLINGAPLYIPPFEQPDATININPDGVRSLKAKILPTIRLTDQKLSLIDQKAAEQLLLSGQGIILKVNNTEYSETGPLFDIAHMDVRTATLGYIIDNQAARPAYIFQGISPNKNDLEVSYIVEVAVPATKQ